MPCNRVSEIIIIYKDENLSLKYTEIRKYYTSHNLLTLSLLSLLAAPPELIFDMKTPSSVRSNGLPF